MSLKVTPRDVCSLWMSYTLDDNHRIFVHEDDMWTVKGRYNHALEDDDDVSWTYEKGNDVLRFLLVSFYGMFL